MGDASDMSDVARFINSEEGREYLRRCERRFVGKKVIAVTLSNETDHVGTVLVLEGGEAATFFAAGLDVNTLREETPLEESR